MIRCTPVLLAAAAVLATGCAQDSEVTWLDNGMPYHGQSEQGWWHYQFVYHPNAQVYFEPHTKTYYWFEDNVWQSGSELPRELTPLDGRLARVVKLNEAEPMLHHESVLAQNPPSTYVWHPNFDPRQADFGDVRMAEVEQETIEVEK